MISVSASFRLSDPNSQLIVQAHGVATNVCRGEGQGGILGNNQSIEGSSVPVPVAGGHTFVDITLGVWHACALDAEGLAWCWGAGREGKLGFGSDMLNDSSIPVLVRQGRVRFVRLSAGGSTTCGLEPSGRAWCWVRELGGCGMSRPSQIKLTGAAIVSQAHTAYMLLIAHSTLSLMRQLQGRGNLGVPNMMSSAVPVPVSGGLAFNVINLGCCGPACGLVKNDSGEAWHQRNERCFLCFVQAVHSTTWQAAPMHLPRTSHAPLLQSSSPVQPCLWRSAYEADTSSNTAGRAASGQCFSIEWQAPFTSSACLACVQNAYGGPFVGCFVCSVLTAAVDPFL